MEKEKHDFIAYSADGSDMFIPDNKAIIVRVEGNNVDTSAEVNKVISIEYQCGWVVQDIVYIGHLRSVLILFKIKGV